MPSAIRLTALAALLACAPLRGVRPAQHCFTNLVPDGGARGAWTVAPAGERGD